MWRDGGETRSKGRGTLVANTCHGTMPTALRGLFTAPAAGAEGEEEEEEGETRIKGCDIYIYNIYQYIYR